MSRVGRRPIPILPGVEVSVEEGKISVRGPRGVLEMELSPGITVKVENDQVAVQRESDSLKHRSLHGLYRSLINNMVVGVSDGFSKTLEIRGVGYRATKSGNRLELSVGYSHPVVFEEPEGISFEVPNPTTVIVKGMDRQQVGNMAAKIRVVRKPEPYKGKGIRYLGEYVRHKAGKTGA
ncbi:large subunit ribosomal protein L6 [Candidatus Hakubella thermalkaliphila]|uniref:Large ribosomal subunit protein uL6 n=3 Tax=Candidatus Hakubella thermalkaliphila TaxID=2754717 RepID=A0A6V8NXV8_9ACTN|nr:50S ribosomal protein L6 [Candidatus Hakubella thermalkaliphila]MBT9170092.1 50S ribosomal protein L6 [Actinomycetota bacterium]GFP23376.1 large subunit ribosomal protein L6 [Candidatus Hakubella thermalkaliphila]GFP30414.1 large subunit ribosomal protein L6 [Candidatus Hakubella thermalkaliphila]GFP41949.1 large subunit ribosomal protein L6 [Candidatus Hakubella thermalkaliphila]